MNYSKIEQICVTCVTLYLRYYSLCGYVGFSHSKYVIISATEHYVNTAVVYFKFKRCYGFALFNINYVLILLVTNY